MKRKRTRLELEIAFQEGQRRLPRERRLDLLAWLKQWRKGQGNGRPARVFWLLTETGEWKRL